MRLVLKGVSRTFEGSSRVFELRIPRFEAARGEVVALVGESGSGKTAMLELLALAAGPDPGGEFLLESIDIAALWRRRRLRDVAAARGRHLGFVAQTGGLLGFATVRTNAALAQEVAGRRDGDRIVRLAEQLGLDAVLDERPASLSIGQRQRAAILRALAHRPDFVIADEPTSALDPGTAANVIDLLLAAASREGAGVILSTHNMALMQRTGVETVAIRPDSGDRMTDVRWVSVVERRP